MLYTDIAILLKSRARSPPPRSLVVLGETRSSRSVALSLLREEGGRGLERPSGGRGRAPPLPSPLGSREAVDGSGRCAVRVVSRERGSPSMPQPAVANPPGCAHHDLPRTTAAPVVSRCDRDPAGRHKVVASWQRRGAIMARGGENARLSQNEDAHRRPSFAAKNVTFPYQ